LRKPRFCVGIFATDKRTDKKMDSIEKRKAAFAIASGGSLKRDIDRKSPTFHTPSIYLHDLLEPLWFFLQNLNTNCPSSKAITM